MKFKNFKILFTLSLLVFFISCKENATNINSAPEKVIWINKTADDFYGQERGIDAYGEQENSIILEWKALTEKDIENYILYASDTDNNNDGIPDNFLQIEKLPIEQITTINGFTYNDADTSYSYIINISDFNFDFGKNIYFYIKAQDEGNKVSEVSDTIYYQLINPIELLEITKDLATNEYYLTWSWPQYFTEQVIIRIEEYPLETPFYIKKISGAENIIENYYSGPPKLYLNKLNVNFDANKTYRFRVDIFKSEYKGSESSWVSSNLTK